MHPLNNLPENFSQEFSSLLLKHYAQHARVLPWRAPFGQTQNPYYVWISEVMLQQTTVETVLPYYKKFLELWPTLEALAQETQQNIYQFWSGLGYYRRASSLHQCAQLLCSDYGGSFPRCFQTLLSLPGIGEYTASALMSLAYQIPYPVVDGNIERIISRIFAIPPEYSNKKRLIKTYAALLTPSCNPGDYAQALMDLGSQICRPKNPLCSLCPLQKCCQGKNSPEIFSAKIRPKQPQIRHTRAFCIFDPNYRYVLIRTQQKNELLAGMHIFPYALSEREEPIPFSYRASDSIIEHRFTHIKFFVTPCLTTQELSISLPEHCFWHPIDQFNSLSLPTLAKKIWAIISKMIGF